MLRSFQAIDNVLIKIQQVIIVIAVLAMVLLIVWQVIARYLFYLPAPYAEELARLAIVWCIFFGASVSLRYEEHMQVDALYRHLPRPAQALVGALTYALIAVFTMVMIYYGCRYYNVVANDFSTSLGYDRNIFYLPTPVCGALMFIYCLGHITKCLKALTGRIPEAAPGNGEARP
jgi:TRAP-type C4-dicarboxylate transport system permease small subunit